MTHVRFARLNRPLSSLALLCLMLIGSLLANVESQGDDRYAGLDTTKFLGEVRVETVVETEKFFTEGPAVAPDGSVFFSNIPTAATGQILKWDSQAKQLSVFRSGSNGANGLNFDGEGRLVTCEGGLDDRGRVTRTDLKTGEVTVLMDSYNGHPLGAPNDLTLDRKGRIYFTARLANTDPQAGNVNAVYRIDPDGKTARILASPEIDMPNGVDTSPDDKFLYLIESDGRDKRARCVRAYDLQSDGTVMNDRVLYNFYPGRSGDGLTLDEQGNLYVAAGLHKKRNTSETLDTRPGIHVISPEGKLLAFAQTPEDTITNCAFGGPDRKTLYITCGRYLLSCPSKIAGRMPFGK